MNTSRKEQLDRLIKELPQYLARELEALEQRTAGVSAEKLLNLQEIFAAHHYRREPGFVLSHANGVWVWDVHGNMYIDCIATYSAIACGHANLELVAAMLVQLASMTSSTNRYTNDVQPLLAQRICDLTGQHAVLLMNTGAEGVDTFIKAARRFGYRKKKIPKDRARIISATGNFHGRTIGAIALSATEQYREDFGPFPRGFKQVPYGNIAALKKAMTPYTAAVLLEPIQGEGGIIPPPPDYLKEVRELCWKENVLLGLDEIQTGLGRTGKLFGGDWAHVKPDCVILGKALGQYIPVSAFAASEEVICGFTPGSHGSTFGGTALSCATALKSLEMITRDNFALVENSRVMGEYFLAGLKDLRSPAIKEVRGRGLFIGMEINTALVSPDVVCSKLLKNGVLSGVAQKTVRFTPPLIIKKDEVEWALKRIAVTLDGLELKK